MTGTAAHASVTVAGMRQLPFATWGAMDAEASMYEQAVRSRRRDCQNEKKPRFRGFCSLVHLARREMVGAIGTEPVTPTMSTLFPIANARKVKGNFGTARGVFGRIAKAREAMPVRSNRR